VVREHAISRQTHEPAYRGAVALWKVGAVDAQGKILRLQRQPGSKARPQGMKQDANDRFRGVTRLPTEAAYRNDYDAARIIGMHRED
jgi:hypothetical protein